MSQKMMQTQVCKGSNHVRVIPQGKQKSYTHTCTQLHRRINHVRSKLCMIYDVFMLKLVMAKMLHTSYNLLGIYVTCTEDKK